MNQIDGIIHSITTENHISLVTVKAAGALWNALVIDTKDTAAYLREGNTARLVFKESVVSIAKGVSGDVSIRNRVACTISDIQTGEVLASVSLAGKGFALASTITANAVKELNLQPGDEVEALIKTTDISLMKPE